MEHGMDSFGTEFRFRCAESGQLQGGLVPVDSPTVAAGYCKTWRVTTEELRHALDARAKPSAP
jgi:3D-(3,5/4)-trihydroxycyclohexane-1,2-dione acylhydrolase (decyclizing)